MPFCYCLVLFMLFCYLKSLILLVAYDVNVNCRIVSVDHNREQLTLHPPSHCFSDHLRVPLYIAFAIPMFFVRIWDANI